MKTKFSCLNKIRLLSQLKDEGFISISASQLGHFIYCHYDDLIKQIKSGNMDVVYELQLLAVNFRKREEINSYLMTYFPIKCGQKKYRYDNKKMKLRVDWYAKENLIPFDEYVKIYRASGGHCYDVVRDIKSNLKFENDWVSSVCKALKWPDTEIGKSVGKLMQLGWINTGLLSYEGYRVGTYAEEEDERLAVLDEFLLKDFSSYKSFSESYLAEWGCPMTWKRLMKMANTIASLCRNAKRSPFDYSIAIKEWESDLSYLKRQYYDNWVKGSEGDLEWPLPNLIT